MSWLKRRSAVPPGSIPQARGSALLVFEIVVEESDSPLEEELSGKMARQTAGKMADEMQDKIRLMTRPIQGFLEEIEGAETLLVSIHAEAGYLVPVPESPDSDVD